MGETEDELFRLNQRLEAHVMRFEQYERRERKDLDRLVEAQKANAKIQQANTDAITSIAKSTASLVEDTKEIIQLHKDFQGAARMGKSVQGFMLWCLKWGVIGTGIVTGITWSINHFKH